MISQIVVPKLLNKAHTKTFIFEMLISYSKLERCEFHALSICHYSPLGLDSTFPILYLQLRIRFYVYTRLLHFCPNKWTNFLSLSIITFVINYCCSIHFPQKTKNTIRMRKVNISSSWSLLAFSTSTSTGVDCVVRTTHVCMYVYCTHVNNAE
jgi:hypothetical protein